MVKREFKNYKALAKTIVEQMNVVEDGISVVCFYNDAKQVIKEIINTEKVEVGCIALHDEMWSGYDREFYITVWKSVDSEGVVLTCEEGFNQSSGKYLYDEQTITYVFDNCHSQLLPSIKPAIMYEVSITEKSNDDYCDCDICCADTTEKSDVASGTAWNELETEWTNFTDNMHGFSTTKTSDDSVTSFSFYSTDKDLVKQMAEKYY